MVNVAMLFKWITVKKVGFSFWSVSDARVIAKMTWIYGKWNRVEVRCMVYPSIVGFTWQRLGYHCEIISLLY